MSVKHLCLVCFLFCLQHSLSAQKFESLPKFEFQLGYGILSKTSTQFQDFNGSYYWCGTCFEISKDYGFQDNNSPNLIGKNNNYNAHFSISLGKRWRLKLTSTLRQRKVSWGNGDFGEYQQYNLFSNLVRTDYYWFNRKGIGIYSGIGLGVETLSSNNVSSGTEYNYKDISNAFNYHINGLGLRIGGKIGGFLELGYGAQGIVAAGLSARL